MIYSFDAGGTLIKVLNSGLSYKEFFNDFDNITIDKSTTKVIVTGARANRLKKKLSNRYDVEIINEIQSIGSGGSFLSKKKICYVISVGSGSPIIDVSDSIATHLVGTGMGAGTIFGLSSIYTRTDSVESINVLAETGTGEKLNLVIDDIYDQSNFLNYPSTTTVGNFANQTPSVSRSDFICSTMKMVAETLSSLVTACMLNNIKKDVVIVGGGTFYPKFNQYIIETLNFYDLNGIVPEDALYAGCYGALIHSGNLNG